MSTTSTSEQQHYYSAPPTSSTSLQEDNESRTRTPSPRVGGGDGSGTHAMGGTNGGGGGGGEMEVPSPIPASVSSTTSSEPPLNSQHGSSGNMSGSGGYYGVSMPPVPNPFAPNNNSTGGPSGWGANATETGVGGTQQQQQHQSYSYQPQQSYHHPGAIPMVVSAPSPPSSNNNINNDETSSALPNHHSTSWSSSSSWARNESCPNFSIGTTDNKSGGGGNIRSPRSGKSGGGRRRSYTKINSNQGSESSEGNNNGGNGAVNSRRQKRLERNRESARLSRRRRKQYLEVLEDRVTQLSTEVDEGRRAHASQAVTVVTNKRREVLEAPDKTDEERVRLLEHGLGRNSSEMMLLTTFKHQQLKSFSLPPHSKFILWLTLQNDQYFRGGRAASERLSAARIGERMLNSGNDRVPPAQSMWPLFCNEVGLSYDQEERVRNFQRTLLQSNESWLERHTARAADLTMTSVHDSTQAMSLRLGQRERSMVGVLNPAQKVKFLSWAEKNREKLNRLMEAKVKKKQPFKNSPIVDERFKTDKNQHVAANLYILNYRLQKVLQAIPRAAPLVTGLTLKKLSRRPSFESLGRCPTDKNGKDGDEQLSRENSFASSGSLKRSASVLSMDGDRPQLMQISPDEAEETCKPAVEKVLGYLHEIIPPSPAPQYGSQQQQQQQPSHFSQQHNNNNNNNNGGIRIPSPAIVTSTPYQQSSNQQPMAQHGQQEQQQVPAPAPVYAPNGENSQAGNESGHKKQSSFIPPYLNVVPEEMFPNDGTADDFLMSLVDEDWAIGEGIDMDTTN